jgi:hypothetical protein
MTALITQLVQYGTMPALLVLAFVVGLLVKKIDANGEKDAARSEELRNMIERLAASTEKRFLEHEDRMACIERDYLLRETHYKDLGGWRTDLNQVRTDIAQDVRSVRMALDTLNTNLINTVLQGAKNGG